MCGILATLCDPASPVDVSSGFNALSVRGPDSRAFIEYSTTNSTVSLGFHRLRINDLSSAGDQPMSVSTPNNANIHLICNGEIYNHNDLNINHNLSPVSNSDCETVLHLYRHMLQETSPNSPDFVENVIGVCQSLDAEFAFVIYDASRGIIVAARDPYGVRPLFWGKGPNSSWLWSSEIKGIAGVATEVTPFLPGSVMIVNTNTRELISYTDYRPLSMNTLPVSFHEDDAIIEIRSLLTNAVRKRVQVSERPVCALLSGGLDSSLVASLAASFLPKGHLHTFSIGMHGSTDLVYAKQVAEHIGSTHTNITLSETDFLEAIEETIRVIESYDTTSVRASVGNYLVSAYIARHTDNKVVLNGDYADEVCGGYKYMALAPDSITFAKECTRLVDDIYLFDSLRSDRTICSQGLEARTPFSDPAFVRYYMSLPPAARMPTTKRMEKYLLRKAFEDTKLLPEAVLWRRKEAFSDGVSHPENSWHRILQAHIESKVSDQDFTQRAIRFPFNTPALKETYYYRTIFESYYPGNLNRVIPYYWLPRFCGDLQDPSAREIKQ